MLKLKTRYVADLSAAKQRRHGRNFGRGCLRFSAGL
jgi:hypothetical protein